MALLSSGQVVRQPSVESTASWGGAGPATMPSIPEQGPPTGYSSEEEEEEEEDSDSGPPGNSLITLDQIQLRGEGRKRQRTTR